MHYFVIGSAHRLLGTKTSPPTLIEGTSKMWVRMRAGAPATCKNATKGAPNMLAVYAVVMHMLHGEGTWGSGKAIGGVEHLSLACLATPNQAKVPVPATHSACWQMRPRATTNLQLTYASKEPRQGHDTIASKPNAAFFTALWVMTGGGTGRGDGGVGVGKRSPCWVELNKQSIHKPRTDT